MNDRPVTNGGWCCATIVGRSEARERAVEPVEAASAELAAGRARDQRVEHHQPHVEVVDDVLHEAVLAAEMALLREGLPQHLAVVVVAHAEVDRHRQRAEEFTEKPVLRKGRVVGQVAGHDDRVGKARQRQDLANAALEHARRVDPPVGQPALGNEMRIADLAEKHADGLHVRCS